MSPTDEAARLARLLAGSASELASHPLIAELLTGADPEDILARMDAAGEKLWGHRSWQSIHGWAGRIIATARAGRDREAEERCRELGVHVEGGSVGGHALAVHALLGRYDRLEDHPRSPDDDEPRVDDERAMRLEARNRLLRDEVRVAHQLRLAINRGDAIGAIDVGDARIELALAARVALEAGDLVRADTLHGRLENHRSSAWSGGPGAAVFQVSGLLGRARVAWRRGVHAMVIKHASDCLAIDETNARALVLATGAALRVGFNERAASYLERLEAHHPFENIAIEGLEAIALEAELGWGRGARADAARGDRAFEEHRFAAADAAYARALEGARPETPVAAALIARWLWCIAALGDHQRLQVTSERVRGARPDFVTAIEASAYASAALGDDARAAAAFDATGLGRLLIEDAWLLATPSLDVATWADRPVEQALSPLPVFAAERVSALIHAGSSRAALAVLGELELEPGDPTRYLVAGAAVRLEPRSAADRARLADLAAASIRGLEGDRASALGARIECFRRDAAYDEDEAEAVGDVAWNRDQRGLLEPAIDAYLRASEARPAISAVFLANAGNLLCAAGDHDRAWPFFEVALASCSCFPPDSRSVVLAKVGRFLSDQGRFADALPVCSLAFELSPSAEGAAALARCYRALGDETRTRRFIDRGRAIEPRAPALLALEKTLEKPLEQLD